MDKFEKFLRKSRFTAYRLDGSERPKTVYEYYVTGRGAFPFDMLRFDSCWPASGEDAAKLDHDISSREHRSVKLRSYREPTVDRWSSFVWSVGTEKL